ncbi:MAG: AMP-binding protein [Emcibacter sp.]|nr:AMP-binding protein [Emcibacter sp.]
MNANEFVSYGHQLRKHAAEMPDTVAISHIATNGDQDSLTWRGLDHEVSVTASRMVASGIDHSKLLIVSLPDSIEHFIACLAAWKLGACVLPLSPDMPAFEENKILEVCRGWRDLVIVSNRSDKWCVKDEVFGVTRGLSTPIVTNFGDTIAQLGKAIGSGGSTGSPKIIIDMNSWARIPEKLGWMGLVGMRPMQKQLIFSRLYHNIGFLFSHVGLFEGHTIFITPTFNAGQSLDLIGRHRIQFFATLPIMMQRMVQSPNFEDSDLSSLESCYHAGSSCPEWVKKIWINRLGPQKVWEGYGATEEVGGCFIRGDEWLKKPGSVGLPYFTELELRTEDGKVAAAGQVGEVYSRSISERVMGQYLGAPPLELTENDLVTLGDLGRMDEDGYLFLADRKSDMIISGGANVYPAEVEAVLSEHPDICDVVVIGLPDDNWGSRVHAIIEPTHRDHTIPPDKLKQFCGEKLSKFKIPKSYEWVKSLDRDPSGKVRRKALKDARTKL